VTCGWDGPLQTFFLQVEAIAPTSDDNPIVVWMGADWREHLELGPILKAAALWALIPPGLAETLKAERDSDRRASPPPLMAALNAVRRGPREA
jgi:hypothetical protein